ncbi:hypothetical protein DFH09DRAFT_1187206 [Mycena vulgaris]|nr:hypothetical protein DFH09DRAFT_1187206 [Mycena vulgaris]
MSSPFTSKLGTNYCPKDDEVAEIKTFLIEPSLRLKRLEDEIADMHTAIDKLKAERDGLSAYVEAHMALISPVRRLPLDLIQEIFVACIPTHRNCVMSAHEPPVLLGRICSFWRAISLSTPRLWARLHIVEPMRPYNMLPTRFEEKFTQRLETTKMWLSRSGQCPLSISLEGAGQAMGHTPPHDRNLFLEMLITFASRWQHIDFTILPPIPDSLSKLTENDVPMLRDIAIYERPDRETPITQWSTFQIFRGPNVTTLAISGGYLRPTTLLARWSQLTVLSIVEMSWISETTLTSGAAIEILSWCPALRVCNFTLNDYPGSEIVGVTRVIQCPSMTTLDLDCGFPASTIPWFFSRLSLPGLQHFKLRGYCDVESHGMPSFSSFLAASPRLERLDIATNTFSKESLIDLLRGLPHTLQQLQISPSGIDLVDDDLLSILTPSSEDTAPCCPTLRVLVMEQCRMLSDAALMRFINFRMTTKSCTPLERVQVYFTREMELDLLASLREFTDSGLHLALTYRSLPVHSELSPWLGIDVEPVDM